MRRFKTVAVTLAVVAVLCGLSLWRYGPVPMQAYPVAFRWLTEQIPLGVIAQSLAAKLGVANLPRFQRLLALLPSRLAQPLHALAYTLTTHSHAIQTTLTVYLLLALVASGLFTLLGRGAREPLFIITGLGMMLSPGVMWYHHYVFILLPLLVWLGWRRLDWRVTVWCLSGLLLIQVDRWFPTYGLLIHLFAHISLLAVLIGQAREFLSRLRFNEDPQPLDPLRRLQDQTYNLHHRKRPEANRLPAIHLARLEQWVGFKQGTPQPTAHSLLACGQRSRKIDSREMPIPESSSFKVIGASSRAVPGPPITACPMPKR